ncbi:hypothetical protein A359_08920 [secondary endosymbiont of Ctenarytaina eucalypti]|uniref:Uncharacterized protein n=1 Tax=secondary endosymbiont of Ctenarytaina eucalypti TaxID=1199245 RepID=J3YSK2_9ENTR|nr:hypothetical protein A359_08920 [secondary endosymbiont of Ctenarytaina eucalypti]
MQRNITEQYVGINMCLTESYNNTILKERSAFQAYQSGRYCLTSRENIGNFQSD